VSRRIPRASDVDDSPAEDPDLIDDRDPPVEDDPADSFVAENYYRSRQRKESALADLRQLEVLRRAGELVPVAEVAALWTRRIQAARSALLALPSRVRAACAGVDEGVIRAIDSELRAILVMVSDDWRGD